MSSRDPNETRMAAVATVAAVAVTAKIVRPAIASVSSRLYVQYLAKNKSSSEPDGSVSGLFIHPVKSLRPVSLQQADLDEKGFIDDRRFMVVYPVPLPVWKDTFGPKDSTHRFLTQRQCPSLATVVATIENNHLVLTCGEKSIRVLKDPPKPKKSHLAGIWDDQVRVDDMGDTCSQFLQTIVDKDENCQAGDEGDEGTTMTKSMYQNIRLVSHSANDRPADPRFTPPAATTLLGSSPLVGLTDGFPILIACQASLDKLNEKLKEEGKDPIPMSRFRPNIVIQGTAAFEEDRWKTISIGDAQFAIVKACPRCKQSCTDQESGKVSSEPVAIMKNFRALGEKKDDVFFAQNAIPLGSAGSVRVGDQVRVLQTGEPLYC